MGGCGLETVVAEGSQNCEIAAGQTTKLVLLTIQVTSLQPHIMYLMYLIKILIILFLCAFHVAVVESVEER